MAKNKRGRGRKWTAKEIALLMELYSECPFDEIAKRLGRTVDAVKQRAYSLGLKRKSYLERLWTAEELQMLREQYPTCESTRELARKIGRPWGSVRQIASNLGITNKKRSIDYEL
ncbi:MAG: hypothetical protein DRP65_11595 [Planctomycetota bacterium]|nr:MAG: hypothetical protein DRP65_11595 [Planctomycetota bacterium]